MLKVQKPYETPHGITLPESYWVIVGVQIDFSSSAAQVIVCGYPTKDVANRFDSESRKPPVGEMRLGITGQSYNELCNYSREDYEVAEAIKSFLHYYIQNNVPLFSGSEMV